MKCSFCGTEFPTGTGKMYVKKDGKVMYFCSSKCSKNMLLIGRKSAKLPWTEDGRASRKVALSALKHKEASHADEKKTSKAPAKKTPSKK